MIFVIVVVLVAFWLWDKISDVSDGGSSGSSSHITNTYSNSGETSTQSVKMRTVDTKGNSTTKMVSIENSGPFFTKTIEAIEHVDTNPDLYVERAKIAFREGRKKDAVHELDMSLQYSNSAREYVVNYLAMAKRHMLYQAGADVVWNHFDELVKESVGIGAESGEDFFSNSLLVYYLDLYCNKGNLGEVANRYIRSVSTYYPEMKDQIVSYCNLIMERYGESYEVHCALGAYYAGKGETLNAYFQYKTAQSLCSHVVIPEEIVNKLKKLRNCYIIVACVVGVLVFVVSFFAHFSSKTEVKTMTGYQLAFSYDHVKKINADDSGYLVSENQKYGYLDNEKNIILSVEYDSIAPFAYNGEDYLLASRDDKKGLYRKSGEEFVPIIYQQISTFAVGDQNYLKCGDGSQFGLLGNNGETVLPIRYTQLTVFDFDSEEYIQYSQNDKIGLMDENGQVMVPAIYQEFEELNVDGLSYLQCKKNETYGLINLNHQIIIPFESTSFSILNGESSLYILRRNDDNIKIYDTKGVLISDSRSTLLVCDEQAYYTLTINGKQGLMIHDQLFLNAEYNKIYVEKVWNDTEIILAQKGDHTEAHDASGQLYYDFQVISVQNTNSSKQNNGEYYLVSDGSTYGVLNNSGSSVVTMQYQSIQPIEVAGKQYFKVNNEKKYGVIDLQGNSVLNDRFDSIEVKTFHNEDCYLVEVDGNYCLYNDQGRKMLFNYYPELEIICWGKTDCLMVKSDGKYGVMSEYEEWYLLPKYDKLTPSGTYLSTIIDGQSVLLDLQVDFFGHKVTIVEKDTSAN